MKNQISMKNVRHFRIILTLIDGERSIFNILKRKEVEIKKNDSKNEELPPPINIDTVYWSFTINIDSTIYAASDIYKYWDIDNRCRITQSGGDIEIKISDKSDYSHISGGNIDLRLIMHNVE